MANFKVTALKHGYSSTRLEREIVEAAGGEFLDTDDRSVEEGLRMCEDAEGVLTRWTPMTPEVIRGLRRCKIIVRYGVGTDNVDLDAATEAGIMVGHVPNYCMDEVSNHAIALWMACVRGIARGHERLKEGAWGENPFESMDRTAGRAFGLIGFGHIGQTVARKLSGWNMRLMAADPFVEPERAIELGVELTSFETVLRESDYLSLHLPLLPETRRLIGERELRRMKRGAVLVNTARGAIVDAGALLNALDDGQLAQAGLDVFETEPLPPNDPIRRHPRVVLSDHVAWYSEESREELRRTAAEELVRACRGELPRSMMNPEVLRGLGRWDEWTPSDTARWQLRRMERLSRGADPGP